MRSSFSAKLQTHHVYAVGSFGPTNLASWHAFEDREKSTVKALASILSRVVIYAMLFAIVLELITFNYSLTKDCSELAAIAGS